MTDLQVAAFRPDDDRMDAAVELLESLGVTPLSDPMLAVEPTGVAPRSDADFVVLTSKTGAELARDVDWHPGEAAVCAIGDSTAEALRAAGYDVDLVPTEFSSAGLINSLEGKCTGARVEVARSDHGSDVLLEGLNEAGAYVHETVLYRLVRPADAGESAVAAARGQVDVALFTSSLTVEHFLAAAEDRGVRADAIAGLNDAVVGAIGEPTRETAESEGLVVDVVPEQATFERLARTAIERARAGRE